MSKLGNVRGTLVFALAVSLVAPQVASAKGGGGGGGSSRGSMGSASRMSTRMSTPTFQPMKSFGTPSNLGSASSSIKFNKMSVGSNSTQSFQPGLSNVNAIRMTDRFSNAAKTSTLKKSGKLSDAIVRNPVTNGAKTGSVKISDAITKGPKLNPDLAHKLGSKIGDKPADPGKGGAKPIDPGKGNGQMPNQKFCKSFCKWPWWPMQIGWFPYGCYPYGYPYGGYRFGCYNTVSYLNASTAPFVDLALADVRLVEPATVAAGPAYRVTFRNLGNAAASAFRVAVFGTMDGELSEDTRAVAEVSGLAAGATSSVTLRLPISAMHLTSTASAETAPFKLLTVALDIDNVITESVKDNNAATLERASFESR